MRTFPYINAFGVELEGGWDEPFPRSYLWNGGRNRTEPPEPEDCLNDDGERCHECDECYAYDDWQNGDDDGGGAYRHGDGSVGCRGDWIGEIATPPYKSWSKFKRDFDTCYPNHVDRTCGMHVHISPNPLMGDVPALYGSMMTKRFQKFMLNGMTRWGKLKNIRPGSAFWHRLAGRNDYCLPQFQPDDQARCTGKDSVRYRQFNFCYACMGRGTLEYRFLPMFEDKAVGESAIRQLLRLSNRYLVSAAKKTLRLEGEVEEVEIEDPGETEEVRIELDAMDFGETRIGWEQEGVA